MDRVLPVLQIDSYDAAVEFYVNGLGFEILMEHRHEPGFPVFMIIGNGDLELALSEHGRGHPGSEVYVYVNDIELWHKKCQAGLSLECEPEKKPWGNTEMLVIDPSRNALRFSQVGTHAGESTANKL